MYAATGPLERRTKIVATLGPSTTDPATLRALIAAGVDVVRLNGSHGSHDDHRAHAARVRAVAAELGQNVGILFDLQGPKIRVGAFNAHTTVCAGDELALAVGRAPAAGELSCDYEGLADDVQVGEPLLIDDGAMAFVITHVEAGRVGIKARNAGTILPRKGINLPKTAVRLPALTPKDRIDALFAAELEVDLLALSFVRQASDVEGLDAHLRAHGWSLPIISKIEKPQALQELEGILHASWGVMVARGDLGVELNYAEVPLAQKRIIRAARLAGKPVITATQMLESMTGRPTPTRAEASDVANAVLDGTDAVMLSAESASGQFPVQSVQAMGAIIDAVEGTRLPPKVPRGPQGAYPLMAAPPADTPNALAQAGCLVAHQLHARALVAFTESGRMALLCGQKRPQMPIVALAGSPQVAHALALCWGVRAIAVAGAAFTPERLGEVDHVLQSHGIAQLGEQVVLLVGAPQAPSGSTNLLVVHQVGHADAASAGPLAAATARGHKR